MTNLAKINTIFIFLLSIAVESCTSNESPKNSSQIDGSAKVSLVKEEVEHGKSLFQHFCNTCHMDPEIKITHPILFDNIFDRLPYPAENYFKIFIQDSRALKNGGDKHALEIDKMFNSDYEHIFKDSLSNEAINSLITYIKIITQHKY